MPLLRETIEEFFVEIKRKISESTNTKDIANLRHLQLFLIQKLCLIEQMVTNIILKFIIKNKLGRFY